MSRQDANAAFALTSFLYGGNAGYIEDLYARYQADPKAVDAEWQAFFWSLKDNPIDIAKSARGASWQNPNWPLPVEGDWGEVETTIADKLKARAQAKGVEISSPEVLRATRNSIHALMLIRAYRVRGHLH